MHLHTVAEETGRNKILFKVEGKKPTSFVQLGLNIFSCRMGMITSSLLSLQSCEEGCEGLEQAAAGLGGWLW